MTFSARNLVKIYGRKFKAIDSVSFKLYKNEIICLYGKNGSGKSTLIKILAGITSKSRGEIRIYDSTSRKEIQNCHEVVSYCPQNSPLPSSFTCK